VKRKKKEGKRKTEATLEKKNGSERSFPPPLPQPPKHSGTAFTEKEGEKQCVGGKRKEHKQRRETAAHMKKKKKECVKSYVYAKLKRSAIFFSFFEGGFARQVERDKKKKRVISAITHSS
jgi:hypothetical protein